MAEYRRHQCLLHPVMVYIYAENALGCFASFGARAIRIRTNSFPSGPRGSGILPQNKGPVSGSDLKHESSVWRRSMRHGENSLKRHGGRNCTGVLRLRARHAVSKNIFDALRSGWQDRLGYLTTGEILHNHRRVLQPLIPSISTTPWETAQYCLNVDDLHEISR
jgi:hypothetical protein